MQMRGIGYSGDETGPRGSCCHDGALKRSKGEEEEAKLSQAQNHMLSPSRFIVVSCSC